MPGLLASAKRELATLVGRRVRDAYGIDEPLAVEVPPRRELGDLAVPVALQLAKRLARPPRAIAEELAAGLALPPWISRVAVEGPGFLNFHLERRRAAARLIAEPIVAGSPGGGKIIVEHTNINPNKAAHVGHLRNAVLGDVLARTLRALDHPVEVQNYIDDTGVQLADVVVGFLDLRSLDRDAIAAIPEPFDYYCWDLYSEVTAWYDEEPGRLELRRRTLHALEADEGERAEVGRLVSERVVSRHLATMRRIGVTYDLLTHESAILGLDFFARAFELLRDRDAIRLESEGKNAGCWIMPLADSPDFAGLEDADKVIVRSDGTVTYVGKDIAYQLWKLGLLGLDFRYRFWEEEAVWQTAVTGAARAPSFGAAERVINVIDTRQSYLQKIVRAGVERAGFPLQAEQSIHFAYDMVALSPAAAAQMGFAGGEERVEMSGRKGLGVKADDLLDQLEAKSRDEVLARNAEIGGEELALLARQIATAAVRFLMAKATTQRVIAFDFEEALNFEGDSGPYLLYSLVRAKNILRRLAESGLEHELAPRQIEELDEQLWSDDLWDLAFTVAQIEERVMVAAETLELSLLARLALELAQKFNAVYHRHPVLQEKSRELRSTRLAAIQTFLAGLTALAELLGLPVPERM